MTRTFKEVPSFTKKWQSLGLTDDDLRILEQILLRDPKTGDALKELAGSEKYVFQLTIWENVVDVE